MYVEKDLIGMDMKLPRHRLFILGAGFSKPAGFPLGSELLDDARLRIRKFYQMSGWDGAFEKEIGEWQQLYPRNKPTLSQS